MKRYIAYSLLALTVSLLFASCNQDTDIDYNNSIFTEENEPEETAFDKSKLETQVKALNCEQKENQEAPENAYVSFNNSEFTIVPETEGTELKVKEAYQMISEAISSDDAEVDLGSNPDAYVTADVTSDSADLQATVDAYNNFAKASITYTFVDETVTLDGNTIKDWLQFDEKDS